MVPISDHLPNIFGLLGVSLIVCYYFLLQIDKIPANSFSFSFANFIGACLILVSLWFNWNLASVVIEVFWLLISLYGIYRSIRAPFRI